MHRRECAIRDIRKCDVSTMAMLSVSKQSLVEQKKQQWAKEREEMSHLYLPWGSGERYTNRQQIRNQFASTLELHHDNYDYPEPIQRQRSPSLPPIHNTEPERAKDDRKPKEVLNRNISSPKRFNLYEEDAEGDTSGYGSETINHRANGLHLTNTQNPVIARHQDESDSRNTYGDRPEGMWSSRSARSGGTTGDEGRPRWGDRGVATGRLWEPTAPNARLPQVPNQKKGTPSWVERGLNMIDNADVLVIDQRSSSNSGGFECDRSSYNGSDEGKTYLRGQNVPLEPEIKAQRENQRIRALELQTAILNQLEDQEKRRQEERQMKLREERLEELKIQRQQEEDRLRLEDERRRNEEKQIQEQRKLDALKKALEEAEKKAKIEKEKRFSSLKQNVIKVPNGVPTKTDETIITETTKSSTEPPVSPSKSNRTYDLNSAKTQKNDSNSHQTTGFSSPLSSIASGNLNLFIHSVPPVALSADNHNQYSIVPIGINGNGEIVSASPTGIQLAVIVPQNIGNNLYSVSLNSLNTEISEPGKILTPRKFRIPNTKDVCTQTDTSNRLHTKIIDLELERTIDKDYSNIDENAPQDSHHNSHKDRRYRSEERYKKDLENRPKWGVNRPAAQYKKQSEKDPFYSQKRKMRQKYRAQARQYLSQSSDDSRSPSPPTRSDKSDNKSRNSLSQSYWKSKRPSQDISKNSNDPEVANMISGEFNHLGLNAANDTENKKSPKMSPSKRMTLSQKFINDKYGNRKMWIDEPNGKSNTFLLDPASRKKLIDHINMTKRDYYDRNDEQEDKISY